MQQWRGCERAVSLCLSTSLAQLSTPLLWVALDRPSHCNELQSATRNGASLKVVLAGEDLFEIFDIKSVVLYSDAQSFVSSVPRDRLSKATATQQWKRKFYFSQEVDFNNDVRSDILFINTNPLFFRRCFPPSWHSSNTTGVHPTGYTALVLGTLLADCARNREGYICLSISHRLNESWNNGAVTFSVVPHFAAQDKPCERRTFLSKRESDWVSELVTHYPPFHTYLSEEAFRFSEYRTRISLFQSAWHTCLLLLLM